jgi:hypothetical protein
MLQGIKKAGGPIWPSGSVAVRLSAKRQMEKGTDLPRTDTPKGASVRSRLAAGIARKVLNISEICSINGWRGASAMAQDKCALPRLSNRVLENCV